MNTNTNQLLPIAAQPEGITRRSFIKRTASTALVVTLALGAFENEARAENSTSSQRFPVYADRNDFLPGPPANPTAEQIEQIFLENDIFPETSAIWLTASNTLLNTVVLYLVCVEVARDNAIPDGARSARFVAAAFYRQKTPAALEWTTIDFTYMNIDVSAKNPRYENPAPITAKSEVESYHILGTEDQGLAMGIRIEMMFDSVNTPTAVDFSIEAIAGVNIGAPNGLGTHEVPPGTTLPLEHIVSEGGQGEVTSEEQVNFAETPEENVI